MFDISQCQKVHLQWATLDKFLLNKLTPQPECLRKSFMSAIISALCKAKLLVSVLWGPQPTDWTPGQWASHIALSDSQKKRDGDYIVSATPNWKRDFSRQAKVTLLRIKMHESSESCLAHCHLWLTDTKDFPEPIPKLHFLSCQFQDYN